MPDMQMSLFISYTHIDSPFVDRLEADLRLLTLTSMANIDKASLAIYIGSIESLLAVHQRSVSIVISSD